MMNKEIPEKKEKREKIGKERNGKIRKNYILGIAVCALIAVLLVARTDLSGQDLPSDTDEVIRIPLSNISETAQWFTHKSRSIAVRYFVVKALDGTIKTGFDACDVCYRSRRGYSQEGPYMVCNNCGNTYPITGLGIENANPGGCWPGYLPSYTDGEYVIIKKSDLEERRWMFA